ncbi:MAG: SDR family NAD(P)-dependent oxidoreductase [Woeseiaceae bacterium]|jgi:NAD(P)-dependent dehydrogenase (short-subunit alcohol dehydrogenase family)
MTVIARALLCATIALAAVFSANVQAEDEQKAVLVTGASSGIGLRITEYLADAGHFVYAGARKPEDIERLSAMDNVMGIRLDVTVQQEIDAAVELVRAEGRGLWGIINNAGVYVGGPMLEMDEADLDFQLDVNVYGPYRVNKAFADMILESGGRFNVISSISGVLSGPGSGAYSMSKHAMEAYTDALAAELRMVGANVHVSAIEPGNFRSEIANSACDRALASGKLEDESRWPAYNERMAERCEDASRSQYPEPDAVARAALHAMFDPNPKEHYMVVPVRSEAERTIYKAIEELVELNRDHQFSFTRDELVEMLDDEIDTGDGLERAFQRPRQ